MTGEACSGDGHGTHVASTAVGRNVGVAKEAHVVAVRVLDCEASLLHHLAALSCLLICLRGELEPLCRRCFTGMKQCSSMCCHSKVLECHAGHWDYQ